MQSLFSPRTTLFVVLAACGLAAWYVVPKVHPDLQFVLRCAIFSVPMLLGAHAVSELQETFAAHNGAFSELQETFAAHNGAFSELQETFAPSKAKLPSQLVDMASGTTIALVHPDGVVEIVQPDWYDQTHTN